MPITRSFNSAFEIVDWTQELQVVPNSWTLLNDVGLFSEEMLSTRTVTFEEQAGTLGLIGDQLWGSKPQANKDDIRKIRTYPILHFPGVDAITPADVQGKRAYGTPDGAETEAAVMARKIARIRKNHDITLEVARFRTLGTGDIYAPNGTFAGNFYTDFGVSRKEVDFVFGTTTTDIIAKVEQVIAHMQDNANTGDVITGIVAYCSPTFFAALISHPKVVNAFQYYTSTQEPLRERVGGNGLYRQFVFGGVTFIEVRTVLAGTTLVTSNDAIFVPTGTSDNFVTYYAPADHMDFVNTMAERQYLFSYRDPKGTGVELNSESNFINVLRRPQLVVRGYF